MQILERLGNATIMYVETKAGQIVIQDDGDVRTNTGENVGVIFDPRASTSSPPTRGWCSGPSFALRSSSGLAETG